jgi:hypothetical protein
MAAETEDDLDTMPEAELLALPEQALPEDLSRLWAIRANAVREREFNELVLELSGDTVRHLMIFPDQDPKEKRRREEEERRRAWIAYEETMRGIRERSDRLLLQIEERQIEIAKREQEIENNALRLRDGRRVYVDGDRYRDGEGRVLAGPDEAEAARQRQYQPHASTWQQKDDADREAQELLRLKEKILQEPSRAEGAAGNGRDLRDAETRLTGYEKEFTEKAQERAAQAPVNFGGADYIDDYGVPSAVPAFTQAAENVTRETIRKPAEDEEAGTRTAEMQKALRPAGQGAFKLG